MGTLAFQSSDNAIIESGRIDVKGGGSNLLLWSEQVGNAYWAKVAVTVTENSTTAPDGTATADTLIPTATTTAHFLNSSSGGVVGVNTLSIYAKPAGYSYIQLLWGTGADYANFFLSGSGSISQNSAGSPTVTDVGNGWYRCSITSTLASTSPTIIMPIQTGTETRYPSTTGDGTSGIYIWGAQVEKSSTVGNYIATTTSAVSLENALGATQLQVPASSLIDTTYPMAFELASNTSLVVKVKGSDGVLRSATLTLA